jgi:hypothetical protein
MPYKSVHAPVYGYLKGSKHTIPLHLVYLARTFSLVKLMNRLRISSVINVGGAEGFQGRIIKKIFNVKSVTVDISF